VSLIKTSEGKMIDKFIDKLTNKFTDTIFYKKDSDLEEKIKEINIERKN